MISFNEVTVRFRLHESKYVFVLIFYNDNQVIISLLT